MSRNNKNGWKYKKLGDENYFKVIMGQSPPSKTYNFEEIGLPFFQGKAEFGKMFPMPKKYCSEPTRIAEKNDVLISVRAPVGPTNLANTRCCIGRGLAAIRCEQKVLPRFLFY
ncbi:MAG: restriction endonuclease subunit S, partial [Deltaproteobacteria bacterium]|nr:restriction endonuclease subunit S [Deltaproteobacteria bacterium]